MEHIDNLLKATVKIRNEFAKTGDFNTISKKEQKTFTILSIGQIDSIWNFINALE